MVPYPGQLTHYSSQPRPASLVCTDSYRFRLPRLTSHSLIADLLHARVMRRC